MIATLEGKISEKLGDTVILELAGVGYELVVTVEDFGATAVGQSARFYVYEQIREDAHNLFGFRDLRAKQLFLLLLSVSGVGPKVAMGILSATSIDRLQSAIAAGDPDLLRGVSGVGRKTAERVMLELRGKLDGVAVAMAPAGDPTYQALVALGYTSAQAAEAVAGLPAGVTGDQERIKAALRVVSK